jgi:catechol 2,3-dioxygenase-like lactoylglutathione lyase family enzyme
MAVKEAKNDYVMIIDEDFVFPLNWEELVEKAKEHDFVSGNLMERGGSFAICDCGGLMNFDEQKFEAESLRMAEDKWENGFGFPLICKKEIWELVEGYDESYDPWGSNCDSDLEYKLMLAGIMPKRWKGVLFYHFVSVSGTFAPENNSYWRQNIKRFEDKWGFVRANSPYIWNCDFVIDGEKLKYKPAWAKLDNPNVYYKKFELKHTGWLSNNIDLFERFWVNILGFKQVWESTGKEMFKDLFDIDATGTVRRYERDGITIEVHFFDKPAPENNGSFFNKGINHFCLLIDDRDKFLKMYPFEKRIYNNPKGHQNIFIKDFEGNYIEIYKKL